MKIRVAKPQDYPRIAALHTAVYPDKPETEPITVLSWSVHSVLLVAEERKQILGTLAVTRPQESTDSITAFVYAAAVHPSHQGKGIMQSLLKALSGSLQVNGIEYIRFQALDTAVATHKLALKYGAEPQPTPDGSAPMYEIRCAAITNGEGD